jgi:hsp70-interacting protein
MDKNLNNLLRWSIENTPTNPNATTPATDGAPPPRNDPALLRALFDSQPSDADLLRAAMAAITAHDPPSSLENRRTAWDNVELLLESHDVAGLLAPLGLWQPLLARLESPAAPAPEKTPPAPGQSEGRAKGAALDALDREMAAWAVGTAVQNHLPEQQRVVALGGLDALVRVARVDAEPLVRKRARRAVASVARNCQEAGAVLRERLGIAVDMADMAAVDAVVERLRVEGDEGAGEKS